MEDKKCTLTFKGNSLKVDLKGTWQKVDIDLCYREMLRQLRKHLLELKKEQEQLNLNLKEE